MCDFKVWIWAESNSVNNISIGLCTITFVSDIKIFIIKEDFHLATMNDFHIYKILKYHVFEYFCYPMSKFKDLRIFRIIPSCKMWQCILRWWELVGRRWNLQTKPLFLATTEMAVLDESVVVSYAGHAVVWCSEDFPYIGRWLRCWMTLCWELLEVFEVSIIVDFTSFLQPLASQWIPTLIYHLFWQENLK